VNGVPINKSTPTDEPARSPSAQDAVSLPQQVVLGAIREEEPAAQAAPAALSVSTLCWARFFESSARVPELCAFFLFRELGAIRAVSRQACVEAQRVFDARWARMFPSPWSAVAGCDATEMHNEEKLSRDESQARFNKLMKDQDRMVKAMREGDGHTFSQVAQGMGPEELCALDMVSGLYSMVSFGCPASANDRSLLHYAAIRCDLAAARWLLRRGASPNIKSEDQDSHGGSSTFWMPLHHAARNGDVPMCKLLLTAGADPTARIADPDDEVGIQSTDNQFRSLAPSLSTKYRQQCLQPGSTAADVAAAVKNEAVVQLLRAWPQGTPRRAQPEHLAPEKVTKTSVGCEVAGHIAASVAEDQKPLVFRPRHRYCKVPGPLCPQRPGC